MVDIQNLTAGYGGAPVLSDLTLRFPRGQLTVIIGPNGCGKSTLLRSLVGLTPQIRGGIFVDGQDAAALSPAALAQKIAYLPQNKRPPDMTAEQLVLHGRFPYLRYPRRYRPEDRRIARQAMERLGIEDLSGWSLPRLSGGTRQKCYIAMALAQDSPTILMDEPTSFLDISHQLHLMDLVRDLSRQGKAMVLVLHDLSLALQYADRLILMDEGRLRLSGSPEEVLQSNALEDIFGVHAHRVETDAGTRYCFTRKD